MFKMQTDNHIFTKNVATDKKCILRKMSLKFQNSKSYIFCYKLELFGVKRSMKYKHKWLNKTVCLSFLKKTKTIHKITIGNSTISIPIKSVWD